MVSMYRVYNLSGLIKQIHNDKNWIRLLGVHVSAVDGLWMNRVHFNSFAMVHKTGAE